MKTRPVLTLEDCKKISAAAEAEARKNKWEVAIAILDDGGHILHALRTDGATPANVTIATEKARTAALTRRSSKMWEERIAGGRLSMLRMPGVLPVEGGLPIIVDGTCVGSVGVSGVASHEDAQIGQAGIDALMVV
jgi:glc operon protein GlcG